VRIKGAVLLLCVSALFYSVEIFRRTHVLTKAPPDAVSLTEERLARVKKRLPANGVIGYVSDDSNIDESVAWRRYATTQYVLAPLILERTAEHELVLGVFKDPSTIPAVVVNKNLLITEDFGDGIVLLRKK
jgi:hypothetical protein